MGDVAVAELARLDEDLGRGGVGLNAVKEAKLGAVIAVALLSDGTCQEEAEDESNFHSMYTD